jgi:hypothetical protein
VPVSDNESRWIRLPITEARLVSSRMRIASFCETARCHGRRRSATTFHAVINVPGEPDSAWAACFECTRLMEGAYVT